MMKWILFVPFAISGSLQAQVMRSDSTWYDDQLTFSVVSEDIRRSGELVVCLWNPEVDMCIENLITTYEINIYNRSGQLLWNSLWTGMNTEIKFKKAFPGAAYIVIRAKRDYAINIITGTRIYTDGYLELKYTLE